MDYVPDIRDWEEFGHIPQERDSMRKDALEVEVRDIFKLFERDNNGQCDVREVGTMVRALGMNPPEKQLDAMIDEMEEKSTTGYIKYKRDPVQCKGVKRETFNLIRWDFRDMIHVKWVPEHGPKMEGYDPPRKGEDPPHPGGPVKIVKGMRLLKINGHTLRSDPDNPERSQQPPSPGPPPKGLKRFYAVKRRRTLKDNFYELLERLDKEGVTELDLEFDHKFFDTECQKPRRFLELCMETLLTHNYQGTLIARDPEEKILKAFEALDPERRGFIDSEYLKELMTSRGERFTNEEVLEMLNAAADPETGYIKYDDYASILATD